MSDDDRRDTENAVAPRTDRSDDAPSSGPVPDLPLDVAPDPVRGAVRVTTGAVLRDAGRAAKAVLRAGELGVRRAAELAVLRTRELGVRRAAELAVRRAVELGMLRARGLAARPWVRDLLGVRNPTRLAVAAGVLCCLGLVAAVDAGTRSAEPAGTGAANQDQIAVSGSDQPAGAADTPGDPDQPGDPDRPAQPDRPEPDQPDQPEPDRPAPDQPEQPPAPVDPGPVAGLSGVQMDNAKAIVRTGHDMGMPRQALIIGVATAMQESELLNRASEVLPESKNYPHQGSGWDHDSVGLFQQRTSTGWGPVERLMDPAYATAQFFEALRRVPGWEQMPLTAAAQAVQVSAYPDLYAQHEGQATEVVDAIAPAVR